MSGFLIGLVVGLFAGAALTIIGFALAVGIHNDNNSSDGGGYR